MTDLNSLDMVGYFPVHVDPETRLKNPQRPRDGSQKQTV